MLIFSKTSIQSFVYDLIDVFMFPDKNVKKIYKNNEIEKCFSFQNLTDTGRTSVFFFCCCKLSCSIDEENARDVIFDRLIKSKILERLDLSDDLWEKFGVQNKSLKEQVGLYEIDNFDNANVVTITIYPEYFETE